MAFMLNKYRDFLHAINHSGRSIRTVSEFLLAPDVKSVVLRHDADRIVHRSVDMAQLEAENGVRSSYYFRFNGRFPERAIRIIADMGHEVGFHYETLSKTKGDVNAAISMFLRQLQKFRDVAPCKTICAHGSPLSAWFSGDIAETLVEADPGLLGDASASMPMNFVTYITDAGGCWNNKQVNLRDRVGEMIENVDPLREGDLKKLLEMGRTIYISTHPERWCSNSLSMVAQSCIDGGVGVLKKVFKVVRA